MFSQVIVCVWRQRPLLPCLFMLVTDPSSPAVQKVPPFAPIPVVEWGKPLEGGTIRALFLLQGAKQEGLEFLRRCDVQGEVLTSREGGKYGVGATPASLARRWLASEKLDVSIVGGIHWHKMPATLRLALLEKVQEGMGLLYVDPQDWAMDKTLPKLLAAAPAPEAVAAVTKGVPLALLPLVTLGGRGGAHADYPDATHPSPTPEQLVTAARFGKGRICLLRYPVGESNVIYLYSLTPGLRRPDAPFLRTYPYWEYCHSLLGKAVRWCAGREPTATLTVKASGSADAKAPLGTIAATAKEDTSPVNVEAVVRDRYYEVTGKVEASLSPTSDKPVTFDVNLPENQRPFGGLYFVDVWAKREGKVVDWATAAAEISSTSCITAITFDKARYAAAEPVRASVAVAAPPAGARLELTLVGTDGRVLQRQISAARNVVTASFSLRAAQTLVSYLDARLKAGRRSLSRERQPVFLAAGPPQEFFAYSWMQGGTYYSRDYLRRIADQAVNAVLAGGGSTSYFFEGGRVAAEMNLRVVPTNFVSTRNETGEDKSKLRRPLTDDKTLAEERKALQSLVPLVAPLQPIGYSLMDEWVLGLQQSPTDYSDSAVAAFRPWLREKYADLAALNAEWGTAFAGWDDVKPTTADQIRQGLNLDAVDLTKRTNATRSLNLAPFVDYRLFMDTVGPTAFSGFAATIREMDPDAKVGLCGTESNSTWFGYDWFRLCNALDFICGYGDANVVPNIADFRGLQRELQRSFRRPGSLLACWVGYSESDFYRDQALKLLLHDFNGIAYFSGEPQAYEDFPYLDYDFTLSRRARISGEGVYEIRRGLDQLIWNSRRDNSGIALYLSQPSLHVASALGQEGKWDSDCVAMTRAVEDAGMQYDFVAPEQVEKGILRERGYRALVMPGVICLSEAELGAVRTFIASGGVVLFGRAPGLLDGHGKSRAAVPILEGEKVAAFPISDDRAANADAMRRALGKFALSSPVTVEHAEKAFLPTETILYRNGEHLLVSLQTDLTNWTDQPKPTAKITLPKEGFVYDVRQGKPLAQTQAVTATLDPMHILLYAVLPYEVKELTVTPTLTRVAPGASVTLRLALRASRGVAGHAVGTHFVRVTVESPDGKPRPGFSRTVRCQSGRGETTLHLALNDPVGKWTVTARDAETGTIGTARVEVGGVKRPEVRG